MTAPLLFWDVDTQVDFLLESGALYVPEAETILGNLARLTDAASERKIPIIASACDHEEEDAEISAEPDFVETYPPHCLRGTPGASKVEQTLVPWSIEVTEERVSDEAIRAFATAEHPTALIHKKHFDVFSNPNTEPLLDAIAPARVVVYGVALDVCNRAAIEGMLARGRSDLVAVTDATKPIRAEAADALLADWAERGVSLRTTDEVLAQLA